ncbi:MAG: ABC transporter ATP-binding protein [Lentisphaeria bacterium]|nr:ABC transporter ATP-binding protein [Lentisphaeria bacterium]NQZ71341.1 ABC transporter ATP-binding protein [Lentisphaeria bacterium]
MIRFTNVHKSFGDNVILNGLNIHVPKGETMVLVGGSGTGKSVSLKHMIGLLAPDEGEVLIDGENISTARGKQLESILDKFGVLFQSGALLQWKTVFDNIALPLLEKTDLSDDEIREKVMDALDLVNLDGAENKFPSEISGGMNKRAALARAIITKPQILLYDEPTSGLDPVMSRHVDGMIKDMQEKLGVTSVVITHDLHSAFSIADKVTMLFEGQSVESSHPEEFIKSEHPFVKEFIKSQFETGKVQELKL